MTGMATQRRKPKNLWQKRIRAILDKHDLTHQELADKLHVSRITLRTWLYGRYTPAPPTAALIDLLFPEQE